MKRLILANTQHLYFYRGPVYRFGKDVSSELELDRDPVRTMAKTQSEAKRNIVYKLKQRLNLDPKRTKIEIQDDLIDEVLDEVEQTNDVPLEEHSSETLNEYEQPTLF